MKKTLISVAFILTALGLTGCSSVPNVPLSSAFWQQPNQTVAIAPTPRPTPTLRKQGDQRALDMIVSDLATKQFSTFLASFSLAPFYSINNQVAADLHGKHINTSSFSTLNPHALQKSHQNASTYALRDYTVYTHQLKNNKLLVITIDATGAERGYYGFIPLGAPKAYCSATGRIIDAQTNRVLWRKEVNTQVSVVGKWDQPPSYPNFTKALQQALTEAKQQLLDDFTLQA